MANNTIGFNYSNEDTDRFQDMKIKRLVKHFKGNGYSVWDFLKNEIYRVKGYYIEWDEDTIFDVANYWGLKESTVEEIVNYCCYVGLFNKGLLSGERILTSTAIQTRFLKWSRLAKRKDVEIPEKHRIVPEKSGNLPEETPLIPENSDEVKRSKVKGILLKAQVLEFFKQTSNYRLLGEKYKVNLEPKFNEFWDSKVDLEDLKGKTKEELIKYFSSWLPKNLIFDATYEAEKIKSLVKTGSVAPRKPIDHRNLPV